MTKLSLVVVISFLIITFISFCYASSYDPSRDLLGNSLFKKVGQLPILQTSTVYNFHVYWHESFIPPNASSIVIGGADLSQIDPRGFGTAYAFDCPLTIKPKVPTTPDDVIGNAQGYYILSAREEVGLAVTMNMHFKADLQRETVLSFQGRVQSSGNIREVPIIGGSGQFRYATGYYKSQMVSSDPITHQNIVVFNITLNIPDQTTNNLFLNPYNYMIIPYLSIKNKRYQ